MNFFTNLRIGTRLGASFAVILALLCGIAAFGAVNTDRMHGALEDIYKNNVKPLQYMGAINGLMQRNRVLVMDMMLHPEPANIEKRDTELRANLEKIGKYFDAYMATSLTDEEKKLAATLAEARGVYVKQGLLPTRDAIRAGNRPEAERLYREGIGKLAPAVGKTLEELMDLQGVLADKADSEATQLERRTYLVTAAVAAAALLLGALLAWGITRSITQPINRAKDAAGRVAEGDLTVDLSSEGKDETAQLLGALSNMKDNLTRIVGDVRQNSESVATASAQIAQGNQDLSSRTEQQASALQETAASMEELGSTVRQNADNAKQANQLAQGASTVAIQGGEVVSQVVETMKGINDSSKKIADIISVIDGIAFQTNILALNAAVEAARAGEQGRGFAVVASEVRSLAQRSAEAAKEIKGLINASVERVEQGTALVDQAGVTMTEIVSSIRRVTDIMGEISAASTEQNAGVAQVGQAVTLMDQATQQNAALVEESAAAAESLKQQALQLVQAVSVFRLSHGAQDTPVVAAAAYRAPVPAKPAAQLQPKAATKAVIAKAKAPTAAAPAAQGGSDWESF
ncbi:MAG: methyl-accepting chemotaxis protein [Rubrivivax sp.]|nr:methyl-accepting chemotaxis protein [Rubrivivax sp.]